MIVPLQPEHLDAMAVLPRGLGIAYFSPGSKALCLIDQGVPVFAGGIVNLQWNRGEAWILPTPFFRSHPKTCLRALREHLPQLAKEGSFVRVQATCVQGVKASIIRHLGFVREGTLAKFGPYGETCDMYARIFSDGAISHSLPPSCHLLYREAP